METFNWRICAVTNITGQYPYSIRLDWLIHLYALLIFNYLSSFATFMLAECYSTSVTNINVVFMKYSLTATR